MSRTRLKRQQDFEEFYKKAKENFEALFENDIRAERFQRLYMLNICPGSRVDGVNKRVVEVFWGGRPFETITSGNKWEALTEYGVTLLFQRIDTGFVTISLYPAGTDNRKPIEESICLKRRIDPIRFKSEGFLVRLWKDFIAYMECTSLDGNPSFQQRLRVSYMRNFKNVVIDSKWRPTKFSVFCKKVFQWIVMVGLSGIIIYGSQLATQPKASNAEILMKETNRKIDSVIKELRRLK